MPAAPIRADLLPAGTAHLRAAEVAPQAAGAHLLPWLLAASIAGAALQLLQSQLWPQEIYACFITLALALLAPAAIKGVAKRAYGSAGAPVAALCVVAVLGGAFGLTGLRAAHFAATALDPALEGQDIALTGTIVAMPQRTAQGLRLRVAVDTAMAAGQPVAVPPLVDLGWWGAATSADALDGGDAAALPDVRAGDRWRFTVRLKAPHGSRNPYGFDYELLAWEQGVQATGSIRAGAKNPLPVRLSTGWSQPVERARQAVRDAILLRLAPGPADNGPSAPDLAKPLLEPRGATAAGTSGTGGSGVGVGAGVAAGDGSGAAASADAVARAGTTAPPIDPTAASRLRRQRAAGVVAALVTGDQRAIDRADWNVFRATGTAHLVSISGLHITMFAWLAALAIGWAWRRSARLCLAWPAPHAALVGGVACAAAYAVFSGGGVPAQRTILMLAVVAALRLAGRRWPWPLVWLLACAAVVLLDPWALLQAGFWLSFVAVGVLFASSLGAPENIAGSAYWISAGGIFHSKVLPLLREQAVVTLALTPLTLLLFGQASVVGFAANLIAIPWMTLVVTPLALLGVLVPAAWWPAAWAVELLAGVLQWMAGWPHAVLALPAAPAWAGAAAVIGGVLLCMRLPWSLRLLGVAPMLPALLWQQPRPLPGQFDLLAADIGQGEAVLVRTAHHALLYDTGPRFSADDDAGHRVLVPLLDALGERLDTVVVSHRDDDHAGGAAAVLAAQPQAGLRSSIEATHPLQRMRTVERCVAGQSWTWDGVRFSFLHPQGTDYTPTARSNALSCVLRVEAIASGRAALLAGDIEAGQEAALVAAGAPLKADVLLAPHHGSAHSSTAEFLQAVAPRWTIVQAGYRNRYGHPAPAALRRYADQGSLVIASPACGAARWSSNAAGLVVCERVVHPHYWQHALAPPQALNDTGLPAR